MSDAYEKSMALCKRVEAGCPTEEAESLWRQVFEAVLIRERFTRHAIDYMWDNLAQGNWERLHQTEGEKAKTAAEWLEDFRLDVFYCSDRWSLDRLTRCHWLWRQHAWALWRDDWRQSEFADVGGDAQ